MWRLAAQIGVTQPVLYSAFPDGRQAVIDAVAVSGLEAMPSGLAFGPGNEIPPLRRAFAAMQEAFPGPEVTPAEVAGATIHGLATLQVSQRLSASRADARLLHAHSVLKQ